MLVTDTIFSYYGFTFACGDIEWSGQQSTAIVGYNSNGDYFLNHPANGIPDIGQIVSCTRQIIPTGGRRKRQISDTSGGLYNLIGTNNSMMAARNECKGLADIDGGAFTDPNNLMDAQGHPLFDVLPACPPMKYLIEINKMFEYINDRTRDCYQSTVLFEPGRGVQGLPPLMRSYNFSSICCYDVNR